MTSTNSSDVDPLIRVVNDCASTPRIFDMLFAVVTGSRTFPASRPMSTTGRATMIGCPAPSRIVARVGARRVYCSVSPARSEDCTTDGFQSSCQLPATLLTSTVDGYVHVWSPSKCQVTFSVDEKMLASDVGCVGCAVTLTPTACNCAVMVVYSLCTSAPP